MLPGATKQREPVLQQSLPSSAVTPQSLGAGAGLRNSAERSSPIHCLALEGVLGKYFSDLELFKN